MWRSYLSKHRAGVDTGSVSAREWSDAESEEMPPLEPEAEEAAAAALAARKALAAEVPRSSAASDAKRPQHPKTHQNTSKRR